MDSFGLRQEQSELLKNNAELKHKLELGEAKIKELHDEEMRYLKEIPEYKKQAEEIRTNLKELNKKIPEVRATLIAINDQLKESNDTLANNKIEMQELKNNSQIILDQVQKEKEDSRHRVIDSKNREITISERERLCDSRDIKHKEIESNFDKREFSLSQKEDAHYIDKENLVEDINSHQNNVIEHNKKVDALIEAKELHKQDEQILENKSSRLDKLIKDNSELKASLLLQADKLSREITITQGKQISLDRSLADLVNQENVLKIKELRIRKMAHDAGLEKELRELEASLK